MSNPHPRPDLRKRLPVGQRQPLLRQLAEEADRVTTQKELARVAGVTQETIHLIRAGRLTDPKLATVLALAGALGFDLVLVPRKDEAPVVKTRASSIRTVRGTNPRVPL